MISGGAESSDSSRRIGVLTFSTLYPNAAQPRRGPFVEQRLLHLLSSGRVDGRVVAPVPWFPIKSASLRKYGAFARVPRAEVRNGVTVVHPRYPLIPKIGMTLAPILMALAVKPEFDRILSSGFDVRVIDAHYFYPDGVAATLIARWLRKPVTITARGTDINLIPRYRVARKQILWAARHSSAMIAVCQALKDRMIELGVSENRITVLRNGVDLRLFHPGNREEARSRLGFRSMTLLSVGYLIERKGHHIAIEALRHIADADLVIVGEGKRSTLQDLARRLGVEDRVRFVDPVSHAELREYYAGADALVLASDREGMANVLLESLACGTPVIATDAWGTPEVVCQLEAGVLMKRRDPAALAEAYAKLMACRPDRAATRRFAERFGWDPTTEGQLRIFSRLGA